MKLPNILLRTLTGTIFVALLLGGMLINQYTFVTLFALVTGLALYEFYTLIEKTTKIAIAKPIHIAGGVLLFVAAYTYLAAGSSIGFLLYLFYILCLFISELYLKRENPIQSIAYALVGQVYIALPLALSNCLVFADNTKGVYSFVFLLAVFVFIWINDSFAYLCGITFGKHRLFERISPKKSWEGFIGGAVFSITSSIAFYSCFGVLSLAQWMGFAAIVVAFGTWGDLFESLLKRTLGVKDSGTMIPGHGGILDRFDSTLLALPAVVVYLELLKC